MKLLKLEIEALVHQERDLHYKASEELRDSFRKEPKFRRIALEVLRKIESFPESIIKEYFGSRCPPLSVEELIDVQVMFENIVDFNASKTRDIIILAARGCDTLEELQVKIRQT